MAEFWVGIKGDLPAEQTEALTSTGIAADDLMVLSQGRGEVSARWPAQWETVRTFVRATAADEAEARVEVARALGLEAADLNAYSAELFS
jgi:hypothetical protein